MTLDTSAVIAILRDEPERAEFVTLIEDSPRRIMSVVSVLEASMVLQGRKGPEAQRQLDSFLRTAAVEVMVFDHEQLTTARAAFERYGKGRHKAGLNFGDCVAYALAQCAGEPLLFKGNDFLATDVARVRRLH